MVSILVSSLKRLYESGRLTREQIAERIVKGSIAQEDYVYITGSEYETDEAPESERQEANGDV